jgi:prepilin-type N-terminal cleavage/methylation domain-containing protein
MTARAHKGMTVLELMIVLAIIAAASVLVRSAFRLLTRADLVEGSTELSALFKRASSLAVEMGGMYRVTMDVDKGTFVVEQCKGATAIQLDEKVRPDEEAKKRAIEKGKNQLLGMPADALQIGDPEEATKRATALAGHHINDRACTPATDGITGDAEGKGWARKLRDDKGVKFKEIWVQHRDDSVTKGEVAVYFFPNGTSEKAVVEVTDGNDTFSVLVFGLTGRVQLKDGALADVNEHMMRNAINEKDAKRDDVKGAMTPP